MSAIADADFSGIADGVSRWSWTAADARKRRGSS